MERFRPKQLLKRELQEAEKFGGSDFDVWGEYKKSDSTPSCDKGGHKERSIAHQPNHLKHWKKRGEA